MTEDQRGDAQDLPASERVTLVLHGIDTVWRAWQYRSTGRAQG